MFKNNYIHAIFNIVEGNGFSIDGEDYSTLIVEGIDLPSESEIEDELNALDQYDIKTAYILQRRAEYPSIEEQLDLLYDDKINNTNKWVETLAVIKEKYPKPEDV